MNFKLNFSIPKSNINLQHGDEVVLIGSCFSDIMTQRFVNAGFTLMSNPFGTLFHPSTISKVLGNNEKNLEGSIVQRDDLFFSWFASGLYYESSKEDLLENLKASFPVQLNGVKMMVVTFGTAWGYFRKDFGIVANCHKQPQSEFEKRLSSVEEMKTEWEVLIHEIKETNPDIKIVFTVSPVRHTKDGIVENNRSKARLIELAHQLAEIDGVYFPSYEIVVDELRDYRFYKNDLVHPTDDAAKYVWETFKKFAFSPKTLELSKRVEQVNATLNHKSLYPESKADAQRIKKALKQQEELLEECMDIFWAERED